MLAIITTAQEVISALAYLHERDLIHGDVRGANIMLCSSTADQRGFTAQVSTVLCCACCVCCVCLCYAAAYAVLLCAVLSCDCCALLCYMCCRAVCCVLALSVCCAAMCYPVCAVLQCGVPHVLCCPVLRVLHIATPCVPCYTACAALCCVVCALTVSTMIQLSGASLLTNGQQDCPV